MKFITLIIGLLVVGCGKQEQADTNESTPTTAAKPDKELTLEEKIIGTYERKDKDGDTHRAVLLENGITESYMNGKKSKGDYKWSISEDGEMHVTEKDGDIDVIRINKDGSITLIAYIKDGERDDYPIEAQLTLKKVDGTTEKPAKELTAEEKKAVGAYEVKREGDTIKAVFLETGIVELYENGKRTKQEGGEFKWIISKEGEIYIINEESMGAKAAEVFRINKDDSITQIAEIFEDGKRSELLKEDQFTAKKIK